MNVNFERNIEDGRKRKVSEIPGHYSCERDAGEKFNRLSSRRGLPGGGQSREGWRTSRRMVVAEMRTTTETIPKGDEHMKKLNKCASPDVHKDTRDGRYEPACARFRLFLIGNQFHFEPVHAYIGVLIYLELYQIG